VPERDEGRDRDQEVRGVMGEDVGEQRGDGDRDVATDQTPREHQRTAETAGGNHLIGEQFDRGRGRHAEKPRSRAHARENAEPDRGGGGVARDLAEDGGEKPQRVGSAQRRHEDVVSAEARDEDQHAAENQQSDQPGDDQRDPRVRPRRGVGEIDRRRIFSRRHPDLRGSRVDAGVTTHNRASRGSDATASHGRGRRSRRVPIRGRP